MMNMPQVFDAAPLLLMLGLVAPSAPTPTATPTPPSKATPAPTSKATPAATPSRSTQVLSVPRVIAQHKGLNGKKVRVLGWIIGCGRYDCELFDTSDGGAKVSLGRSQEFDKAVKRAGGVLQVIVEGTIDRTCFEPSMACLDRPDQIRDPSLVRVLKVLPASPPKAN
jgi:hypothetical protein